MSHVFRVRRPLPENTAPGARPAPGRTRRLLSPLAIIAAALIPLLVLSCSPDRARLGPTGGDDPFTLGPVTTYEVAVSDGGSVADSISGGTFVFPEGGAGTLTVARITSSAVALPAEAEGFSVEYTGDEELELRLPRSADSIPLLWVYGFGDVSPSESMRGSDTWWPVMPEDTLSDPAVFSLVAPGLPDYTPAGNAPGFGGPDLPLAPPVATSTPVHSYRFMQRHIRPNDPEWMNLASLKLLTGWTVRDLIAALPASLQATATTETAGRLAFRSFGALPSPDVSCYAAFNYHRTYIGPPYRRLFPMMSYVCSGPDLATEATVAHEVGHYFTHVFFGDDAFEAITRAQLRLAHDIGSVHSDRPMLEEYAMFVDYFKNGDIRGGADVTEPRELLQKSASIVDFPAQEAYATGLLTRMHLSDNTIKDFSGDQEDIPVIGASFADLFGLLYTRKPTTVNMLRAELAIYLSGRGQEDRLPAILERTGWSYNGYGTVLGEDGLPVAGAQVQSVCTVGSENSREYLAPLQPVVTDKNGRFVLPRIFPGTNMIRVTAGSLVQDFPYTVEPNTRTDFARNIGPLGLQETVINQLRRTKYVSVYCQGIFPREDGPDIWNLFTMPWGVFNRGSWTGNTFTIQYTDSSETEWGQTTGEQVDLQATFSANGMTLTNLKCTVNGFTRWNGRLTNSSTETIDIDDLPLTSVNAEEPGNTFAYFDLYTTQIEPNLRSISVVQRYHDPDSPDVVHEITVFNWTSTENPGHVGVVLYERSPTGSPE